ncbi:hypothetical protein [Hydrogenophaga sp. 2FB]|uniref:hypothetical protein n=1 Tax=Hydrogenophaga sp. 2FB TaxID=2502187 RepID=UPI0010F67796|nr:hypothetical protein [Hydrogenophaga sp. 2FB]
MSKPIVGTPSTPQPIANQPAFTDTGIPLDPVAAGTGGKQLSRSITTNTNTSQTSFIAVIDARILNTRLGRWSNLNTEANRNALAQALRSTGLIDVAHVKRCLQALVSENKAHCKSASPDALHLYMGFGEVSPENRSKVSALAWRLRENAGLLMPLLKDAECEQMLGWISDNWASYELLHKPESPASPDAGASRKRMLPSSPSHTEHSTASKDLQSTDSKAPADILQRATLRDKLFTALVNERPTLAQTVLRDVPSTVPLNAYFPEAVPDNFNEKVWAMAQRYSLQGSAALQTYVTQCHRLAAWHRWVDGNVVQHADAQALFTPELRGVCNVLRSTHEKLLGKKALDIEQMMQAVLKDPRLVEKLAQQPFTSIRTMLDKCEVLGPHIDATVLKRFRNALEQAQALQSRATDALRSELLSDTFDTSRLKLLVLVAFARQVTTLPADDLSANTTPEQKNKIHWRLNTLLQLALLDIPDDGDNFYTTVLRRLGNDVKSVINQNEEAIEEMEMRFAEDLDPSSDDL